jgi:hypothetical protein
MIVATIRCESVKAAAGFDDLDLAVKLIMAGVDWPHVQRFLATIETAGFVVTAVEDGDPVAGRG